MAITTGEWTKHLTAAGDAITNVVVQGFAWHTVGAAGGVCLVHDDTGEEVFHAKATILNGALRMALTRPQFFRRLEVETLDSGEFVVYLV